jgi:ribosome-binding factor A
MADRIVRITEAFKKELSQIIREDLKDPRISSLTSVLSVNVTKDLKYAKAYISVYGTTEEKENAIKGLKSAAGFIRKEIAHRLNLRFTPEIQFEIDNSIEKGVDMIALINRTMKKDVVEEEQ